MASWLFLIVAVVGALCTLIAFRPPRGPGLLMVVGFFTAWFTTELAMVFLAFQFVATIFFVAFGALDAWPGWVGLALTLVSWMWLIVAIRRAAATASTFEHALTESIGFEWAPTAIERRRVWMPFLFRRHGVKRIRNLHYVDDDARRHRLDIFRPVNDVTNAPVLLQIHGGAWIVSNKNQQGLPLVNYLASRGWVCASINYSLSPRATWPEHLVDCKRAVSWIRDNIAQHGGRADYVVVTGGSAGGHLAAMMALTPNDPKWQPGFESVDTTMRAMVPFYGVYDWTRDDSRRDRGLRLMLERSVVKRRYSDAGEIYRDASPMYQINADAPPTLVIHGSNDTLVPVPEAREFVAKLRAVSRQPVAYAELHGAEHAFDVFNSVRTLQTLAGVDAFLTWLVSADPPGGAAPVPPADDQSRNDAASAPATDQRSTVHTEP